MPLLEERASIDSACVSTAPVFSGDGAPKRRDPGWWTLSTHNTESYPRELVTKWEWYHYGWLALLAAVALIHALPSSLPWTYVVLLNTALCLGIFLRDDGDSVLPFNVIWVVPALVLKGVWLGGLWTALPFLYIFLIIPAMDYVLGVDVGNQTRAKQKLLQREPQFRLLTLAVPPVLLGLVAFGTWYAQRLAPLEFVLFSLSIGAATGSIGITVGHELCHRHEFVERACGRFLLALTGYVAFSVEHTNGHHKAVATPDDPATARYGESFWVFLPRVVAGEWRSALHIEAERLSKKELPWWHNEVYLDCLASAALALCLAAAFGPWAVVVFVLQGVLASCLLFQSVNYIEHYGLERIRTAAGSFVPVEPQHSWDSPARLTNLLLIKLQRHSAHHSAAGLRYQALQLHETSPQLPGGYATMIAIAVLCPPLWRAVMHPRLMAHRKSLPPQQFTFGPSPNPPKAD